MTKLCSARCGEPVYVERIPRGFAKVLHDIARKHGVKTAAAPLGEFEQTWCQPCWNKIPPWVQAEIFRAFVEGGDEDLEEAEALVREELEG